MLSFTVIIHGFSINSSRISRCSSIVVVVVVVVAAAELIFVAVLLLQE